MFKWLKRLLGGDTVQTVNIHITGEIKLNYEGRPGYPVAPLQGPINLNASPKASSGMGGGSKPAEPSIDPELFTNTGTTAVDFGINVEEPPKGATDQDN